MATKKPWTAADFRMFDRLTERASSQNGQTRNIARIDLGVFEKRVGKDVCAAMWEEIKKRDAAVPKESKE
jgi:hypothetical protein